MKNQETKSRAECGLTYIELLVGVALLAIAAAWFVPSYIPSHGYGERSKVSRAKADARALATALEIYYIDEKSYPAWSADPERSLYSMVQTAEHRPEGQPSFTMHGPHDPRLTTLLAPIGYVAGQYPIDPFGRTDTTPYSYYSVNGKTEDDRSGWIAWSRGPDRKYDIDIGNVFDVYNPGEPGISDALVNLTYDPTNGIESAGDVWRAKQ